MKTPRSSPSPGLGPLGALAAVVLATLFCAPGTVSAGPDPAPAEAVVPLGPLDAFWRHSPVLGPFHEGGQGLYRIPEHALAGDFPYPKRPFPKEVPFADHLSLVRILGGFNDGSDKGEGDPAIRARDLAYRGENGEIRTRFELLEPRLRPYLENGYTEFTVVLDNVPWAFPEEPEAEGLGQKKPPAEMREWMRFVADFCRELASLLPSEAIETLRFRVGTEMNDERRFDGTQEEFERFYAASVAGIREVFARAEIGFFNIAGASVRGIEDGHNVDSFALAESILREPNRFVGEVTPAIDFIAFSRYFSMGMNLETNVTRAQTVWDEFERRFPELEGVSREIHEFGVAPFGEQGGADPFVSRESGPLGAATTAIMIGLLREAGVDALWHWNQGELVDRFRGGDRRLRYLMTGISWLYQVLEHMRGGEGYLVRPQVAAENSGMRVLGLLSILPERRILLVAGYERTHGAGATKTATPRLPLPREAEGGLAAEALRITRLDASSSVHRRIREDLAEAGLLEPGFARRPDRLGSVREMATGPEAERFLGERFPLYARLYSQSLSLRETSPADGIRIDRRSNAIRLSLTAPIPSLTVLVWNR